MFWRPLIEENNGPQHLISLHSFIYIALKATFMSKTIKIPKMLITLFICEESMRVWDPWFKFYFHLSYWFFSNDILINRNMMKIIFKQQRNSKIINNNDKLFHPERPVKSEKCLAENIVLWARLKSCLNKIITRRWHL